MATGALIAKRNGGQGVCGRVPRVTVTRHVEQGWIAFLNETLQLPQERPYLAIDLFAGCGGLSLGFECAGVKTIGCERLDEPARTLTCRNLAGCTSDMHRIRLEDGRRRRLSVREAARLQSFPDWYEFSGTKEQQFTMIGNAVPPMFSYKLAQSVVSYLKQYEIHSDKHSALSGLAKRAADPVIKTASRVALVKVIS